MAVIAEGVVLGIDPHDLELVVSNIGVIPDYSAIYTSNAGPHSATVQVALTEHHTVGSYEYMDRMRAAMKTELPIGIEVTRLPDGKGSTLTVVK